MRKLILGFLSLVMLSAAATQPQLTLKTVRDALEAERSGKTPTAAPIGLAGYSFHWEISIGNGFEAFVLSRNLAGRLLVFRSDGNLWGSVEIGEIAGLQLFDFDGDGTAELVTEQLELHGTGILLKQYHIHHVGDQGLEELWQGVAYSHRQLEGRPQADRSSFEVIRGFLRLEPSGGGLPGPRLLHIVETTHEGDSRLERHAYLLEGDSFRGVPWPE